MKTTGELFLIWQVVFATFAWVAIGLSIVLLSITKDEIVYFTDCS